MSKPPCFGGLEKWADGRVDGVSDGLETGNGDFPVYALSGCSKNSGCLSCY